MRRILRRVALALIALVVLAGTGGYLSVRRSLPDDGEDQTVTGLTGPVDIVRDADAIPHILASNALDGLFGLGYVHAQERLWPIEFQRRTGAGVARLAVTRHHHKRQRVAGLRADAGQRTVVQQ